MTKENTEEITVFANLIKDCFKGSLTNTAEWFGFSVQTAANYRDGRTVDEKVCVKAEKLENPLYNRKTLRPDDWKEIWPELDDKQAA